MKANSILSPAKLREAADLQESIAKQQNRLTALLSGKPVTFTSPKAALKTKSKQGRKRGSKFTPAQKARISEGLKRKWAERKAAQAATAPSAVADAAASN